MDLGILNAAKALVEFLKPNQKIGLGTGKTVEAAMDLIYQQKLATTLNLQFCYTSLRTEKIANQYNFKSLSDFESLDLVFDGVDSCLENGTLVKGGGGALFREKILATYADKYIIIADLKKLKENFNNQIVPIEISSFNFQKCLQNIALLGGKPEIRMDNQVLFKTDNGNLIADTFFETITDAKSLANQIKLITGVIEHGLFIDFKPILILGSDTQTTKIIYT